MEHSEFQQELIKIDGRFNQMITEVREGFSRMDQRFEAVDKKFESVQQQIDRRFNASDRCFNRQTAMMSIGFLVITTLITIYRFLG